jgi:predicted permease
MTLMTDLRHAWRRLAADRGSFALAAGMLAIAIGVAAAMFTLVDALLLRPVPFAAADRLATLHPTTAGRFRQTVPVDVLRAWRQVTAFDRVEAFVLEAAVIDGDAGPSADSAAYVTPGALDLLGVRAALGRTFVVGEGRAGTDDRVILSDDVWRRQFGADPDVIGRRVRVSGVPLEVVGVMPRGFRFPYWRTAVWRPIDFDAPPPGFVRTPTVFVRRSAEVTAEAAAGLATAVLPAVLPGPPDQRAMFRPLTAGFLDPYSRRVVTALAAGVGLVFLALCANVANLLLARLTTRTRELAVSAALGASRARLLRQVAAEHALLGLCASAAGLALGAALVALARQFLPDTILLRTLNFLDIDLRAVLATSAMGLAATMIAGLAPAWLATRPVAALSATAARGASESRGQRRFTRALLVAEVALAMTLLVGSGVLLRSFVNLVHADRGLDTRGVISGWVNLPAFAFDRAARYAFADALDRELGAMPEVAERALSYGAPPSMGEIYFGDWRTDDAAAGTRNLDVNVYAVDPGFFGLYRIPLLAGRLFDAGADSRDVVVGAELARRLWPGERAVGRSFGQSSATEFRVIGVVGDIRSASMDPRLDEPELYRPLHVVTDGRREARTFGSMGQVFMSLRCGSRCPSLASVRERIRAAHPGAVIARLAPLDDQYLGELERPRAAAALAAAFAVTATLAAAGGLFSVLSYAVGRRRRELGIRAAMGATPAALQRLVIGQGLRVAAAGLALGSVAGFWLARAIGALAYGITAHDPLTWTVVTGVMLATATAASWRPARRAMRADPAGLLRD